MSTLESQGFISEVKITPDMLDKISKGYCLISQEQAHRLMGLANERSELCFSVDRWDVDAYAKEYNRIHVKIEKIWDAVFGEDDALDKKKSLGSDDSTIGGSQGALDQ